YESQPGADDMIAHSSLSTTSSNSPSERFLRRLRPARLTSPTNVVIISGEILSRPNRSSACSTFATPLPFPRTKFIGPPPTSSGRYDKYHCMGSFIEAQLVICPAML